jgi:hypothetical protein
MVHGGVRCAFGHDGFVVLAGAFNPDPLVREMDSAFEDGFRGTVRLNTGLAQNVFRYVPMMCERTPCSVALVSELAGVAAELLGRQVLPVRAKATEYFGDTMWHRDSDLPIAASIGLLAYVETIEAHSGALQVLRGSHDAPADSTPPTPGPGDPEAAEPVPTKAGDIIALDERLWHSSQGGRVRRQWRVDFVIDPVTDSEDRLVRDYFAGIFQPGWDGGYDVVRYPSYGEYWRESEPGWAGRLRDLGALELAQAEEDAVRSKRMS